VKVEAGVGIKVALGVAGGMSEVAALVKGGVGIKVAAPVAGGRSEAGGGVRGGPGEGKSAVEVEVGRLVFWAGVSKTTTARAGTKACKIPTRKVTATRMNRRVKSARGR